MKLFIGIKYKMALSVYKIAVETFFDFKFIIVRGFT